MSRLSTLVVAICMAITAASVGVALETGFGLGRSEAAGAAAVALAVMILINAISSRQRVRSFDSQIVDIARGTTDLALQTADFGRRLASVEGKLASAQSAGQNRMEAVRGEIGELGSLLRQLAGSVADHEDMLASGTRAPATPSWPKISDVAAAGAPLASPVPQGSPMAQGSPIAAPAPQIAPDQLAGMVRRAVESGRIDIYLQPTVSLPQRKVRFYEAVSRLRDDDDRVIAAEEFIGAAEQANLIGRIDHAVMLRAMQVLRRLMIRNDDVGIFCNVSAATLQDGETFAQCLEILEANRSLAGSFVLEFRQATLRQLDTASRDRLASLSRIGYRFSIDHVADFRLEPRDLAEMGVRFVKVRAAMLLKPRGTAAADIAPNDLSDLLGRFGIELIAERIEGERAVADLLDYDVRFGQGFVFSPPRPLRPEMPANSAPAVLPVQAPEVPAAAREASAPIKFQPRAEAHRASSNAAPARRAVGPA